MHCANINKRFSETLWRLVESAFIYVSTLQGAERPKHTGAAHFSPLDRRAKHPGCMPN